MVQLCVSCMHMCVMYVMCVCVIRVGVCVICVGVGYVLICVGVCVHMTTDVCMLSTCMMPQIVYM